MEPTQTEPLVKGGQGRTGADLADLAWMGVRCCLAALMLTCWALVWHYGGWQAAGLSLFVAAFPAIGAWFEGEAWGERLGAELERERTLRAVESLRRADN